jgi:hypothetical protein
MENIEKLPQVLWQRNHGDLVSSKNDLIGGHQRDFYQGSLKRLLT